MKKFISAVILLALTNHLYAITRTVYNGNDSGSQSLREAIDLSADGDIILFHKSISTIDLTSDQITISKNISIIGNGIITIDSAPNERIFEIESSAQVKLEDVTLTNGRSIKGGAILNSGHLTIRHCLFNVNRVIDYLTGEGGGIYNEGQIHIYDCTFRNNASSNGGAIYINGNTTIDGCRFIDNDAAVPGIGELGGAIYVANSASENFEITIDNSDFISNYAGEGNGGAIYSSLLETIKLSNCYFESNSVFGGSGGRGGAIFGKIQAKDCTFYQNSAGVSTPKGGAFYGSNSTLTNCTFFENSVSGNNGQGGAVYGSNIQMYNCTVVNNGASIGGGGVYGQGDGIDINNCIFAGNVVVESYGGPPSNDVGGIITSTLGHNIISDPTGVTLLGNTTGNITPDQNSDAASISKYLELVLSPHKGRPSYLALKSDGIAIDAGTTGTNVPADDQRGQLRDGIPDIGAYEANAAPERCQYVSTPTIQLDLCPCGSKGTLTVAGSFASYLWSTGEETETITFEEAGDYSVIAYDESGCPSKASTKVELKNPEDELCAISIVSLQLEPACSIAPDSILSWKIINPNSFPVWARWKSVNSYEREVMIAPPGESFFSTTRHSSSIKAKLVWRDENAVIHRTHATSTLETCDDTNARNIAQHTEFTSSNGVLIYPNTISDRLNINAMNDDNKPTSVRVINTEGKQIGQYNFSESDRTTKSINTTSWTKGIYLIQSTRKDNKVTTHRIVKQ